MKDFSTAFKCVLCMFNLPVYFEGHSGIDGIPAELHKADGNAAVKELTRLFNRIWHKEERLDSKNTKKEESARVQELAWP